MPEKPFSYVILFNSIDKLFIICYYYSEVEEMNKSLFSLILSEDVVAAVDRLAYSRGTIRSIMVNQILSEYV